MGLAKMRVYVLAKGYLFASEIAQSLLPRNSKQYWCKKVIAHIAYDSA